MFLHYFLLIVSILFTNSHGDNSTSLCSTTYDCGNDVVIKYPFWLNNTNTSNQLCGYPKFGLTCSNNEPLLSLPGDNYYVKNISYNNYTIKLVDADLGNRTCPRARHNVTIDTLPLNFSNLSLNLSFYFNCSVSPFITNVSPIGCLRFKTRQSYVIAVDRDVENGWSEVCEDHVVANVMRSEIDSDLISGFGAAMNEGFELEWDVPRECAACEIVDGGKCGYDQREEMFLCFCEDGTISRGKNGSRCRGLGMK